MPFKSIFRALGRRWQGFYPWTKAGPQKPLYPDLSRLKSRSDWPKDAPEWARPASHLGEGGVLGIGAPHSADPWPVADDPYAKAEPCPVVQDPALERLRAGAELRRPMDDVRSITDLVKLAQRQNAAERDMIDMGFSWDAEYKEWQLAENGFAKFNDAVRHLQNLGLTWKLGRGWHLPPPNLD